MRALGKGGSRAAALQSVLSVGRRRDIFRCWPGVAELADAPDSKSGGRKAVWVRPPPPGPFFPSNFSSKKRFADLAGCLAFCYFPEKRMLH